MPGEKFTASQGDTLIVTVHAEVKNRRRIVRMYEFTPLPQCRP